MELSTPAPPKRERPHRVHRCGRSAWPVTRRHRAAGNYMPDAPMARMDGDADMAEEIGVGALDATPELDVVTAPEARRTGARRAVVAVERAAGRAAEVRRAAGRVADVLAAAERRAAGFAAAVRRAAGFAAAVRRAAGFAAVARRTVVRVAAGRATAVRRTAVARAAGRAAAVVRRTAGFAAVARAAGRAAAVVRRTAGFAAVARAAGRAAAVVRRTAGFAAVARAAGRAAAVVRRTAGFAAVARAAGRAAAALRVAIPRIVVRVVANVHLALAVVPRCPSARGIRVDHPSTQLSTYRKLHLYGTSAQTFSQCLSTSMLPSRNVSIARGIPRLSSCVVHAPSVAYRTSLRA